MNADKGTRMNADGLVRFIGALLVAVVASVSVPAFAGTPVPGGKWSWVWKDAKGNADRPMRVYTYRPRECDSTCPIVMVLHGRKRNASAYRDYWELLADHYKVMIIAPEFSKERWPQAADYNLGGVGQEKDRNKWVFATIEHLFDEMRVDQTSYVLFGQGAGAQVAQRMALLWPENRASVTHSFPCAMSPFGSAIWSHAARKWAARAPPERTGSIFWCSRIEVTRISSGSSRKAGSKEPRTTPGDSTRCDQMSRSAASSAGSPPTSAASACACSWKRARRMARSGSTCAARSFWNQSATPIVTMRPGASVRWPDVIRPLSTPKRLIGITSPSRSATTECTGRIQSGVPSPQRIMRGNVIFSTSAGSSSPMTSFAGRPGVTLRATT